MKIITTSAYSNLTEHEGLHNEGFSIYADFTGGGWEVTGNVKAFENWAEQNGIEYLENT